MRIGVKSPEWVEGQQCQEPPQPAWQQPVSETQGSPGVCAPGCPMTWLTTLTWPLSSHYPRLYWIQAAASLLQQGALQGSQVAAVSPLEAIPGSSPKCQPRRAELKEHTCPLWRGGHPNATEAPPAQAFKYSIIISGCLWSVAQDSSVRTAAGHSGHSSVSSVCSQGSGGSASPSGLIQSQSNSIPSSPTSL